jgi:signal peptidase I
MVKFIIVFFLLQGIHFLGTYRLYKKAGRKYWEAALPLYNLIIMLKIVNRPIYWVTIFFVPIICTVMIPLLWIDFIRCFGKNSKRDYILVILTLGLYIFYLNYDNNINFLGFSPRKEPIFSVFLSSIILSSFIHIYLIQPFTIPTSSMEETLLVGDFIFVSKIHYGLRIPITPISFPLLHNRLPFLGIRTYLKWIRFPYMRLPSITPIKRSDIIVFNFPHSSDTVTDRKDHYLKRCVALPGDTLEIRRSILFINGKKERLSKNAKRKYLYTVRYINEEQVKIMLSEEEAKLIRTHVGVVSVNRYIIPIYKSQKFLFTPNYSWNLDFYGPLKLPKKGDQVMLNSDNINLYKDIINIYENNSLKIKVKKFFINNMETYEYVFQQNYYFMIGDNWYNSWDSRFWGFVPENHIVGKPIFTWMSISWDKENPKNVFKWKLRLERIMTFIG